MATDLSLRRIHATKYRVRLRLESALNRQDIEELANSLASVAGVRRAFVRPNTKSVILETDTPVDEVLDAVAEQGIARILNAVDPPPVGQTMQMGLLQADMLLRRQSDGSLDLKSSLATLLLIGAVFQMTRGKIAGPTTTLLMSALSLMDLNKLTSGNR